MVKFFLCVVALHALTGVICERSGQESLKLETDAPPQIEVSVNVKVGGWGGDGAISCQRPAEPPSQQEMLAKFSPILKAENNKVWKSARRYKPLDDGSAEAEHVTLGNFKIKAQKWKEMQSYIEPISAADPDGFVTYKFLTGAYLKHAVTPSDLCFFPSSGKYYAPWGIAERGEGADNLASVGTMMIMGAAPPHEIYIMSQIAAEGRFSNQPPDGAISCQRPAEPPSQQEMLAKFSPILKAENKKVWKSNRRYKPLDDGSAEAEHVTLGNFKIKAQKWKEMQSYIEPISAADPDGFVTYKFLTGAYLKHAVTPSDLCFFPSSGKYYAPWGIAEKGEGADNLASVGTMMIMRADPPHEIYIMSQIAAEGRFSNQPLFDSFGVED